MATGRVSTTYTDGHGAEATTDVYVNVPGAGTLTEIQTEFAALANLLNNVTACKIQRMAFHLDIDVSGLAANTPGEGVSVNDALGLQFPNAVNDRKWGFAVPGLAAANIVAGGPDMSEGAAIDLLADRMEVAMPTAGLTAGNYSTNNFLALAPIANGYFAQRRLARKARSKSTRIGV